MQIYNPVYLGILDNLKKTYHSGLAASHHRS